MKSIRIVIWNSDKSLEELITNTTSAVVFAAGLTSITSVGSVGETSNAVGSILTPEAGWSFCDWASIVHWLFFITDASSTVVLTAGLSAIATVWSVWEASNAVGSVLAPEACRTLCNWASIIAWNWISGWMPLSCVNLIQKCHSAVNGEWYGIYMYSIDKNGWGSVHSFCSSIFPHLPDSPLRVVHICVSII